MDKQQGDDSIRGERITEWDVTKRRRCYQCLCISSLSPEDAPQCFTYQICNATIHFEIISLSVSIILFNYNDDELELAQIYKTQTIYINVWTHHMFTTSVLELTGVSRKLLLSQSPLSAEPASASMTLSKKLPEQTLKKTPHQSTPTRCPLFDCAFVNTSKKWESYDINTVDPHMLRHCGRFKVISYCHTRGRGQDSPGCSVAEVDGSPQWTVCWTRPMWLQRWQRGPLKAPIKWPTPGPRALLCLTLIRHAQASHSP